MWHDILGGQPGALEIDIEDHVPISLRQFPGRAHVVQERPRVGAQDIHVAKRFDRLLGHLPAIVALADIRQQADGVASERFDLLDHAVDLVQVRHHRKPARLATAAHIGDGDVCSRSRECERQNAPEAMRATRDEGDFLIELSHRRPPFLPIPRCEESPLDPRSPSRRPVRRHGSTAPALRAAPSTSRPCTRRCAGSHRCGEVVDSPIDVVDVEVRADNGGRKLCDGRWRAISGATLRLKR